LNEADVFRRVGQPGVQIDLKSAAAGLGASAAGLGAAPAQFGPMLDTICRMGLPHLRIFISSPGDVAEERAIANRLVRRLSDEFAARLWVEPIFWEHEPLLATDSFQNQIPRPCESQVVVCILWSRLGTRLPANITRPDGTRYASGTEYEFEDAVDGRRKNGYPDLLVYRKTADALVSLKDISTLMERVSQKESLDAFVKRWFFDAADGTLKAAFHSFEKSSEFENVLEEHLRKLIARVVEKLPEGAADAPAAHPVWKAGSPFRGLDVFEFEHAPVFFGRSRAVGDVLNALRRNAAEGRAFVLVVGVSGGGKSSLVRAGVLPVLTQPGVIEGIGLWRRAVLKPGDAGGDPMGSLAACLFGAEALPELGSDGTTPEQFTALLRQNPAAIFPLIKGGLSQAAGTFAREQKLVKQPEARLVLVADQLEELFTLQSVSPQDRSAFAVALSALARSGKVFVIATLRGDFYHRCFELPELVALKEGAGQYDLPMPTPAEMAQMIREPARSAGLRFDEDPSTRVTLDEVLREAAGASPESLPLLEFALEELYKRRTPQGLLTYAAYRELGGAAQGRGGQTSHLRQRPLVASGMLSVQAGKPAPQKEKAEPSRGRPTVEGLFYKLAVIADHRFACYIRPAEVWIGLGPILDARDRPQADGQVPVREVEQVDAGQALIDPREIGDCGVAEDPEQIEAGQRQVEQRFADGAFFPIDDRGESAAAPEKVARPKVAVTEDRRVGAGFGRRGVEGLADPFDTHARRIDRACRGGEVECGQEGEIQAPPIKLVQVGQCGGVLEEVARHIRRGEIGLAVAVFEQVERGGIAGRQGFQVAGALHGQAPRICSG
jgi:hypothetical protein